MAIEQVLIAGGGIGGLTAAACLLQAGFDVDVYEQAPALGEIGAGIQVSPNACRVLAHLGVLGQVTEIAAKPHTYRFRLFDSGEVLQQIPLGEDYVARHGVPYITVHRADLHAILADKVRSLKPQAVHLDSRVTGFREDDRGVELLLADQPPDPGDVLVGADGIKSVIRAQIAGETPVEYSGDAAWRITVPAAALPAEHRAATVDIWVGPARHAVVYPLRRGEIVNLVGLVEHDRWEDESWTTPRPWTELKADFEGWNAQIQAIVDAADREHCYRWAMNVRPPISNWNSRRATLLGDAAHPTLPYMAQGAAMAIEDGAVLARALAQEDDPTAALELYRRNRVERTARVVNESTANGRLFHLPTVAELRAAFSERDMNAERNAWLFSYDPVTVALA